MAWIGRIANQFRRRRLTSEIDEELASHLEEAVSRGRAPEQAQRALGSALRLREQSRDLKLLPWLDAVASDVVFGWRKINKHRAVSAAVVLSLGLAVGATTAAFRLIDAVLLRPLPVADAGRLFFLATNSSGLGGQPDSMDEFDYPTYRRYREILQDRADAMVVGMTGRQEVTWPSGGGPETILRQYFSENAFGVFGLQPALGRLIGPQDDSQPVAVISYAYWTRRFGRDPAAVGSTFISGKTRYEVIGVAPRGFTGTEPGFLSDVFLPATMNTQALNSPGWSWFRLWVRPGAGVSPQQIRQPLEAALALEHQQRIKGLHSDTPKQAIDRYLSESIAVLPVGSGASDLKQQFRRPLLILAVLVTLVLLIACANVGNLLTAQTTARARELALRVSIGAGKWRLLQLLLAESALLAVFASAGGALFAAWSAPVVVSMLARPNEPIQLVLNTDWRALGFAVALTILITALFGLAPAIRASAVQPISALKGDDPHSRRRLMNSMIAAQMAFCVLVLFLAGMFGATFERLSHRPLGFSPERVLLLNTSAPSKLPPRAWDQLTDRLREIHGVESVSIAGWALMSGNRWSSTVQVPGHAIEPVSPNFLDVSPGFFETMRIGMLAGRDFRAGEVPPHVEAGNRPVAGVGIVNEAFARTYFDGGNPVGRRVDVRPAKDVNAPMEIVGWVRDAVYRGVREPIPPTVYVPSGNRNESTILVRTAGNPVALAPVLRREVPQAASGFRVDQAIPQSALIQAQLVRERLLAALSLFFSIVALVLAGIGLYGVLNYAVIQQRRELGIRLALGARSAHVVSRITAGALGMAGLGAAIGVAGGLAMGRLVKALLFEVKATDVNVIAAPVLILLGAAVAAALPPAIRAVRTDPVATLRSE